MNPGLLERHYLGSFFLEPALGNGSRGNGKKESQMSGRRCSAGFWTANIGAESQNKKNAGNLNELRRRRIPGWAISKQTHVEDNRKKRVAEIIPRGNKEGGKSSIYKIKPKKKVWL